MNNIKFEGKITLIDNEAREMLEMLNTKIDTINERTKTHTIDIRNNKNEIRQMAKGSFSDKG